MKTRTLRLIASVLWAFVVAWIAEFVALLVFIVDSLRWGGGGTISKLSNREQLSILGATFVVSWVGVFLYGLRRIQVSEKRAAAALPGALAKERLNAYIGIWIGAGVFAVLYGLLAGGWLLSMEEGKRYRLQEARDQETLRDSPVLESLSFREEVDSLVIIASLSRPPSVEYNLVVQVTCGADADAYEIMESRPGVAPMPVAGVLWKGSLRTSNAQATNRKEFRVPRAQIEEAYCDLVRTASRPATEDPDARIEAHLVFDAMDAQRTMRLRGRANSSKEIKWNTRFHCGRRS